MITLIEGNFGGGKTYSAVREIIGALKRGAHVVTNIPLLEPYLSKVQTLTDEDMLSVWTRVEGNLENPTLLVMDEADIWFNVRDYAKFPRQFFVWMKQTRKAGVDVILIAQSKSNLDAQFARLAGNYINCRDLRSTHIPVFGKLGLPYISRVWFDMKSNINIKTEMLRIDKKVFAAYDSYALVGASFSGLDTSKLRKEKTKCGNSDSYWRALSRSQSGRGRAVSQVIAACVQTKRKLLKFSREAASRPLPQPLLKVRPEQKQRLG